jgi:hypothetical protein
VEPADLEHVSPELALVDPDLARAARAEARAQPWELVAPSAVPAPSVARPRRNRRRRLVAAMIATLAAAGGIVASAGIFPRAEDRPTLARPDPQFAPARTFAWTAVPDADHYRIRFYRDADVVLEARPAEPRYVLPSTFKFSPGRYRWTVEAAEPDGNGYRPPVVASSFDVRG